jgi:hypothetical protein
MGHEQPRTVSFLVQIHEQIEVKIDNPRRVQSPDAFVRRFAH